MSTGTPANPGCPSLSPARAPGPYCALLIFALLLLSSGGSDRITLLGGYLVGSVCLGRWWLRGAFASTRGGRALLVGAAVVATLGFAVAPSSGMGLFIGLDILLPVLLALGIAAALPRSAREWLLIGAGAAEGGVALVQLAFATGRPSGTFGNPTYAALVMVLGTLVAADRAASSVRRRPAIALLGGVAAAGMVATASKSAFAALAAGAAVLLWRLPRRLRLLPLAALALILLVPNPVSDRLRHWSQEDRYGFERPLIWSMAWDAWSEHPLAGLGPGGFVSWARRNNRPVETTPTRYAMRPETAHSQPLQTLVDYGLPGILVLGGCVLLSAAGLARRLRAGDSAAWAPASALAALVPPAFLFPILESPPLVFVIAVGLSLHRDPLPAQAAAADPAGGRIASVGLPVLLAVFLATEAAHTAGARLGSLPLMRLAAIMPPQNAARWQDAAALRVNGAPPGDRAAAAEALAYLDLAARADPGDPATPLRRADILLARLNAGDRDPLLVVRLLNELDSAAAKDPRNPFIPFGSGRIRRQLGLTEQARRDFRKAVASEPNFIAARIRLAEAAETLGLAAEAARERAAAKAVETRWRAYAPRSPYERRILSPDPA